MRNVLARKCCYPCACPRCGESVTGGAAQVVQALQVVRHRMPVKNAVIDLEELRRQLQSGCVRYVMRAGWPAVSHHSPPLPQPGAARVRERGDFRRRDCRGEWPAAHVGRAGKWRQLQKLDLGVATLKDTLWQQIAELDKYKELLTGT